MKNKRNKKIKKVRSNYHTEEIFYVSLWFFFSSLAILFSLNLKTNSSSSKNNMKLSTKKLFIKFTNVNVEKGIISYVFCTLHWICAFYFMWNEYISSFPYNMADMSRLRIFLKHWISMARCHKTNILIHLTFYKESLPQTCMNEWCIYEFMNVCACVCLLWIILSYNYVSLKVGASGSYYKNIHIKSTKLKQKNLISVF